MKYLAHRQTLHSDWVQWVIIPFPPTMGKFGSWDEGVGNFIRENSWLLLKNKVGGFSHPSSHLTTQPRAVMCPRLRGRVKKPGFNSGLLSSKSLPCPSHHCLPPHSYLCPLFREPALFRHLSQLLVGPCRRSEVSLRQDAFSGSEAGLQGPDFPFLLPAPGQLLVPPPCWTAREPEAHMKAEGIFRSLLRGIHWTRLFLFHICCEIPSPFPQKYGYVCSKTSEGPASSEPSILSIRDGPLLSWWEGMCRPPGTPPDIHLIHSQVIVAPSSHSPALLTCLGLSTAHQDSCHPWLLPGRCQHGQRICSPKFIFPKILFFSCRATFHPKCFLSITPFLTVYYEVMLGVTDSTWRKWGTERFDDLGKTTQLVSGRASPWIQFSWQTFQGSRSVALVTPRAGRNFTTSSHPPMLADLALLGLPE